MSTDAVRASLAELVTLKDLKDEESRLRQRRECTRLRGSEEARRKVDAMRDEYNRRKPLAWAAARAALSEPAPAPAVDERTAEEGHFAAASNGSPGGAASWRCFHCDELFTDRQEAQDHFGESEHDRPFCQMDANYIRWLLAQHRRNVDDDSEALRTVRSLAGQHEELRRRAEELGYARGLADAKRHPEELGLVAARSAATSLDADGQMKKD